MKKIKNSILTIPSEVFASMMLYFRRTSATSRFNSHIYNSTTQHIRTVERFKLVCLAKLTCGAS